MPSKPTKSVSSSSNNFKDSSGSPPGAKKDVEDRSPTEKEAPQPEMSVRVSEVMLKEADWLK